MLLLHDGGGSSEALAGVFREIRDHDGERALYLSRQWECLARQKARIHKRLVFYRQHLIRQSKAAEHDDFVIESSERLAVLMSTMATSRMACREAMAMERFLQLEWAIAGIMEAESWQELAQLENIRECETASSLPSRDCIFEFKD